MPKAFKKITFQYFYSIQISYQMPREWDLYSTCDEHVTNENKYIKIRLFSVIVALNRLGNTNRLFNIILITTEVKIIFHAFFL